MRNILAGLALAGAIVTPAFAADPIIDYPTIEYSAPHHAEAFDWSGFYGGINGGYGAGNVASTGTVSGVTTDIPLRGAILGATVGANWQSDQFVFGAEGDLSWSGISGSTPCVVAAGYSCNAEIAWIGTLRARAGIAADNVLFFATGGVAVGRGRGTVTPDFPGLTNEFEDTFLGWTVGAGVEVAVTESVSLKAQYDYIDFGTRIAPVGTLFGAQTAEIAPVAHNVKLGANFHF